ncbi:hypothetical protein KIPB_000049 [Kipferlia bialata]|uniref:Uncharacterized protein n=1 Tax=Kipferlia bialata TaxID=797122 RepID=A0A391NHB3_9EUKA|nr:hypothetical protein KIPB_000049 [Kipferlia bialata]|eukprot:g49.t1
MSSTTKTTTAVETYTQNVSDILQGQKALELRFDSKFETLLTAIRSMNDDMVHRMEQRMEQQHQEVITRLKQQHQEVITRLETVDANTGVLARHICNLNRAVYGQRGGEWERED